jgi:site-specific recombinase XerD
MTEKGNPVSHAKAVRNVNSKKPSKADAEIERWIAKIRADRLNWRTQAKHRVHLGLFFRFVDKKPEEVTLDDIERWRYEASVVRNYEQFTLVHSFLILRKFVRFIGRTDLADRIEIPKKSRRIPPEKEIWLVQEEQDALIKKSRSMGVKWEAIIRLFLSSGMRIGELCALDATDVDINEQAILIRHGKGDKSRTVFFDTETKNAILEYLKVRRPSTDNSTALFTSAYGKRVSYEVVNAKVKECAVLAGIQKKITAHKLRHTFITRVIETTKDIPLAQKLAGHDDIATTMRYHHTTPEEIKSKYRNLLDSPKAKELVQKPMSRDEILRALDSKFLRGELAIDVYTKLRLEYEQNLADRTKKNPEDIAYR